MSSRSHSLVSMFCVAKTRLWIAFVLTCDEVKHQIIGRKDPVFGKLSCITPHKITEQELSKLFLVLHYIVFSIMLPCVPLEDTQYSVGVICPRIQSLVDVIVWMNALCITI